MRLIYGNDQNACLCDKVPNIYCRMSNGFQIPDALSIPCAL